MLMQTNSGPRIESARSDAIFRAVIVCLSVVVAVVAFGGALQELARRWHAEEQYSYGYLIPFIVAWLLWSRRDAIAESVGQPSWIGAGLILIAALMNVVGKLSALFFLQQFGFVLALFGIVVGVGGVSLLKVVFVPVFFLVFAIPLPYLIDASLSWRLQILSSQLGVSFIRLFNIPVFLQGNVIDLGTYKLQVVDACSGLRYLYPLLTLSFLAAYMFRAPMWQRVLIFLSAIPITIVMNSFRIGLVGVLVDNFGPQDADGALHMFEGWVIFLACACILVGEMSLLARLTSGRSFFELFSPPTVQAAKPTGGQGWRTMHYVPLASCLVLLVAAGLAGFFVATRAEVHPVRENFALFPTTLGQWKGQRLSLDPGTRKFLRLTDYILSDFARPGGVPVNFYVAYYATQRSGASPHSPSVCIPGNGWRITEFEQTHYRHNGMSLPLNRAIIMRGSDRELVYYWYSERGVNVASEYWSKLKLFRDAIFKNRTDGALVRLVTAIRPGEHDGDADKRLQAFINVLMPALAKFLPARQAQTVAAVRPAQSH